eukprot:TRINITY_DN18098_c0_g1_i1.p1 TRINITY_DN18098_c0_g1~~TRINITY_DN18098_c0_g1_i1.p1  ORF type:complete len:952 (+),score=204.66 TRINITY_DN18098_c0_g1_i1:41-2896(+)
MSLNMPETKKAMPTCRFQRMPKGCQRIGCQFFHPENKALPSDIQCKYSSLLGGCQRKKCQYLHPSQSNIQTPKRPRGLLGDSPESYDAPESKRRRSFSEEKWETVLIPHGIVNKLGGSNGDRIKNIQERCRAFIYISGDVDSNCRREVQLSGSNSEIEEAKLMIYQYMQELGIEYAPLKPNSVSTGSFGSVISGHSWSSFDNYKEEIEPMNDMASQERVSMSSSISIPFSSPEYGHQPNPPMSTSGYSRRVEERVDSYGISAPVLLKQRGFLKLSQHRVITFYDSANHYLDHHKEPLKVGMNEIVTFESLCVQHSNCGFALVRNGVGETGLVPVENICEDIETIICALCHENQKEFYSEDDYLTHLCLDHFYKRLSCFLNKTDPYICPVRSCGKKCTNVKDLILHYGAIPHAKVVSLVFDASGDNVKQLREDNAMKISSLEKELATMTEKFKSCDGKLDIFFQLKNKGLGLNSLFQDRFGEQILELKHANDAIQHLTLETSECQSDLNEKSKNLKDAMNEKSILEKRNKMANNKYQNKLKEAKNKSTEINTLKRHLNNSSKEIDEKKDIIKQITLDLKELHEICKKKDDELNYFKLKIDTMGKSYELLKKEADEIETERDTMDSELFDLRKQSKKAASQFKNINYEDEIMKLKEELAKQGSTLLQVMDKNSVLEKEALELKDTKTTLETEVGRMKNENNKYKEEVDKLKEASKQKTREESTMVDPYIEMKESFQKTITEKENAIQIQSENYQQLEARLQKFNAEKEDEAKERENKLQRQKELNIKLQDKIKHNNHTNSNNIDNYEQLFKKQSELQCSLEDEIKRAKIDLKKSAEDLEQFKEEMKSNQHHLEHSLKELKIRDNTIKDHNKIIQSKKDTSTCQCSELRKQNKDLKNKLDEAKEYCRITETEMQVLKSHIPYSDSDSDVEAGDAMTFSYPNAVCSLPKNTEPSV